MLLLLLPVSLLAVEGPGGRGDSAGAAAVGVVVDALGAEAVVALVVRRRVPEGVLRRDKTRGE